jgi:hypothetical protein
MKKIPCLFQRDFSNLQHPELLRDVTPGCEWVLANEGIPTAKFDGTACAIISGKLYKRFDCKPGKKLPDGGIPCCDPDSVTGHWPHWVPVLPNDKYHLEAFHGQADGTYELVGPKVNSNPEGFSNHVLIRHGIEVLDLPVKLTWDSLQKFLQKTHIEGIVWHHPDGRMVKLRRDDYGFSWP